MTKAPSSYDVTYPPLDAPTFLPQEMSARRQREHDTFFLCYGKTISAWALVEMAIARVYLTVLGEPWGSPKHPLIMTAFHQVANWRSRLEMVDSVIAVHDDIPAALRAEWSPIYNKATKLSKRRNSIVHMQVITSGFQAKPGKMFFLSDNWENRTTSPNVTGHPRQYYYARDLIILEYSFRKFSQRVMAWELGLEHALGLLPEFSSPATNPLPVSGTQGDPSPKAPAGPHPPSPEKEQEG